jgi:hypothetical protein
MLLNTAVPVFLFVMLDFPVFSAFSARCVKAAKFAEN